MTFSGNKPRAMEAIKAAAFDSLKDAFSCTNINWESKSCERALKEFGELSLLIAETVLSNMQDVGDKVPYTHGGPSSSDINQGFVTVRDYYMKSSANHVSYAEKKSKAFKLSFVKRMKSIMKVWQTETKAFFKRGK